MMSRVELVEEIKGFEVLPIFSKILLQVASDQLSVKDLNNAAGKVRVRIARLKEILEEYEKDRSHQLRKIMIDLLNYLIDRKRAILGDFAAAVGTKFGPYEEAKPELEPEQIEVESLENKGEKQPILDITDYLAKTANVNTDQLENVITNNNRQAAEEEAKYDASLKDYEKLQEELRNKATMEALARPAEVSSAKTQREDDMMNLDGAMDLNDDYLFMNDDLDMGGPGFELDQKDAKADEETKKEEKKPKDPEPEKKKNEEEGKKEMKKKTEDDFFNDNALDLDDFNMNDLEGNGFDDFDFDMNF